ncbi:TetR/AcrR family transcriptional regulator [Phytohabitans rumicis]|uniref:TetR family transcriptional regulator n=1 Tax=Phytohabitans rumicis TaxID=1076125 RepID=A0A6V8LNU3_9ACTN|nr:TetR/AcrR family transcriptional regulator [Phytohabitans rumicis]GFJ95876.1 TetR family transcriptional regulator [Phytohabitans rumicis]
MRKMRADARRNYERLLTEAESAFRTYGTDASLEDIARRAGVAIGTLYAHFPTRQALLESLLRERNDVVVAKADELLGELPADEALAAWARSVTAHTAAFRGLATSLMSSFDDESSPLYGACQAMTAAGERLVAGAREAGAIRPDASASDLFALIAAAAWVRETVSDEQAERLLTFMLDGLRRTATSPAW